jgi:hypothetical protein
LDQKDATFCGIQGRNKRTNERKVIDGIAVKGIPSESWLDDAGRERVEAELKFPEDYLIRPVE